MMSSGSSERTIVVITALVFWLLVPVPFWLLGMGFAGELVLVPSFEADIAPLSLLWMIAFYGPLLVIGMVAVDALLARVRKSKDTSTDA